MELKTVLKLIDQHRGEVFSVDFVKRTDGTMRHMVCRQGVRRYLRGGRPAYDAGARGLLRVADMQLTRGADARPYRSIPIEGIRRVRIAGRTLEVSPWKR